MNTLNDIGVTAVRARAQIAQAPREQKDAALHAIAREIERRREEILDTNKAECDQARSGGATEAFVDRLALNPERLRGIISGLEMIAAQDDPVGRVIAQWRRPNGLQFERVTTPIGVIGIIYESRPNVTVDAAAICIKSGNAVILRGGSESLSTSGMLHECIATGLREAGLPAGVVQFINSPDRALVGELLAGINGAVDLVIPRGGKSLVARVQADARVPVLSHLDGVCHVYIDAAADPEKALAVAVNAKMRRPGVCGAMETLLVDRAVLADVWPKLADAFKTAGCELRGDDAVRAIDSDVAPATADDWTTEYLAPVLSVAAVDGVAGAIAHIARYSSGHTESIVTENPDAAARFLREVDSAIVLHNASTQYADGGEFGFGGEIGIATGRFHARGPVGPKELTIYKTIVRGDGHARP